MPHSIRIPGARVGRCQSAGSAPGKFTTEGAPRAFGDTAAGKGPTMSRSALSSDRIGAAEASYTLTASDSLPTLLGVPIGTLRSMERQSGVRLRQE